MFKQLWASIAGLKTPERRLLFGLMLAIIIVLWFSFKGNEEAKDIRIEKLEQTIREKEQEKETQRILMQDKIDQCNDEKYKDLKDMLERSEKLKNALRHNKTMKQE